MVHTKQIGDRITPSRPNRSIHVVFGLLALAGAACALASRYVPITNHAVLLTAAISPYLAVLALLALALFVRERRYRLAVVALCLTIAMLAVQLPLYVRSADPPSGGVKLRVISANLREGQAEPQYLATLAREHADILAVQELTPVEADRLSAAGLAAAFPYRWLDARSDAQGVGLWSRFPLAATERIPGYTFAMITAQIHVPGVAVDPTVLVAHLPGPWPQAIDGWRHDLSLLSDTLHHLATQTGAGCVIVAGDLNATMDMRPFRELIRDGYRDAAEQSGSGIQPSFPGGSRIPPFIAIDHILSRNCTATSLRTIAIPGSDHRGIASTMVIPASPTKGTA